MLGEVSESNRNDWVTRGYQLTILTLIIFVAIGVMAVALAVLRPTLWWLAALALAVFWPFGLAIERLSQPSRIAVSQTSVRIQASGRIHEIPWAQVRYFPRRARWGGGAIVVSQLEHPRRSRVWILSRRQVAALAPFAH